MSLQVLPNDILRYIAAEFLDLKDMVHLAVSSKSLYAAVYENTGVWSAQVSNKLTRKSISHNPRHILGMFYSLPLGSRYKHAAADGYKIVICELPLEDRKRLTGFALQNGHIDIYELCTHFQVNYLYHQDIPLSVSSNKLQIVKYVIEHSDPGHVRYMRYIQDALLWAILKADIQKPEIINCLLDYGASLTLHNYSLERPIDVLIQCGVDHIHYFLSRGIAIPDNALSTIINSIYVDDEMRLETIMFLIEEHDCFPEDIDEFQHLIDELDQNVLYIIPYLLEQCVQRLPVEKSHVLQSCSRILTVAIDCILPCLVMNLLEYGFRPEHYHLTRACTLSSSGPESDENILIIIKLLLEYGADLSCIDVPTLKYSIKPVREYITSLLNE